MKKLFSITLLSIISLFCACNNEDESQAEPLKVIFDVSNLNLEVNETYTLHTIVVSGNIVREDAVWDSSDKNVATVDKGSDTAKAPGQTSILFTYKGQLCATCEVTVEEPIALTAITLDSHDLNFLVGKSDVIDTGTSYILDVSIEPENAPMPEFEWEAMNNDVVTFRTAFQGEKCVVYPIGIGTTPIKVTAKGTSLSDECTVTVSPRHVTGITCTESLSLFLGSSRQLEAKVIPDNVWDNSVIWESLNSDIATVDASGKVYGKTLGATEVVAKTNDGGFEAKCQVEVCEIDKFVTASSVCGTNGTTATYFYSYLRLHFNTNVDSPVHLLSIALYDEFGNLATSGRPDIICNEYTNIYRTKIHPPLPDGSFDFDTYPAHGWKFIITYVWNDKQYELIHINQ